MNFKWAEDLLKKFVGWIDSLFRIFGTYSESYSKYIVYAVILLIVSKMLRVKVNVSTSRGK